MEKSLPSVAKKRLELITRTWQLFTIGIMVVSLGYNLLYATIASFQAGFISEPLFNVILLESIGLIIAFLVISTQLSNRIGSLVLIGLFYAAGSFFFDILQRPTDFTLAQTFWGFIILSGLIAILLTLIELLVNTYNSVRNYWQNKHFEHKAYFSDVKSAWNQTHKGIQASLLGLLVLAISFSIISNDAFATPTTITPQDYSIEFRFWAGHTPEYYLNHPYGMEILDQFNRHHVTIQNTIFSLRDGKGEYESFAPTVYQSDIDTLVSNLTWFAINYPNINFQYYAFGLGYQSCGNYEGSIYTPIMVKRLVDVCRNYSLPNIVGIYTDWEGPLRTAPNYSNQTMNGWHQALWTDAFAYARTYFPNWTMSCCYPDSVTYEHADGEEDIDHQLYSRYNIFEPRWDDYGGMVYRSCDADLIVDPADPKSTQDMPTSWRIYENAYALVNGELKGDPTQATMWLGCTGCGPYQNATLSYENGEPIDFGEGSGFDAFARDILILKHFRIPTVSIFLGMDKFEPDGLTAGFFDQYGYTDALDRLNTSVNSAESQQSFTIYADNTRLPTDKYVRDFQLNYDRFEMIWLLILTVVVGWGMAGYYFNTHKKTIEK